MPDADAAPAREPLPVLPTEVWQIIACFAQPRWVLQFCDADERNRRDAILRPLSLAIPDLRFRLHSDDNDDFPEDASMHWWHALCGHDWWDPVFGSPDPPSPDDASF